MRILGVWATSGKTIAKGLTTDPLVFSTVAEPLRQSLQSTHHRMPEARKASMAQRAIESHLGTFEPPPRFALRSRANPVDPWVQAPTQRHNIILTPRLPGKPLHFLLRFKLFCLRESNSAPKLRAVASLGPSPSGRLGLSALSPQAARSRVCMQSRCPKVFSKIIPPTCENVPRRLAKMQAHWIS